MNESSSSSVYPVPDRNSLLCLFVGLAAYPRLAVAPLRQVSFPKIQVSRIIVGDIARFFIAKSSTDRLTPRPSTDGATTF
jgi:hypothetical protein